MYSIKSALLSAVTSNGDGPVLHPTRIREQRRSAPTIYVWGAFAGASVLISVSPDGFVWFPVGPGTMTAPGNFNLDITAMAIKATVSGATSNTSINASII